MAWELARCWYAKGERPGHYFKSMLYHKHVVRPEGFLSQRECNALWARDRGTEVGAFLADKVRFQHHYALVPRVRLPRLLGHTQDGGFYSPEGEKHRLGSADDMQRILRRMLSEFDDGVTVFAKPSQGQLGRGAFKLASSDEAGRLWDAVQRTPYIFQETVRQHPDLAAVMPDTLNTLRITTLREDGGAPVAASAWLKVGRRGAVADNAPGMLIIGVDMETGRLFPYARTRFRDGGQRFTHHPDTGRELSGLVLPMCEAAVEMAVTAAWEVETAVVGWDVGIAEHGPVVLEGNRGPSFFADEIAHGVGYLDHPVLGPFFRRTIEHLQAQP